MTSSKIKTRSRRSLPRRLSACISAAALALLPCAALAQQQQKGQAQAGPLEEITVTATFRKTNVQDTPLAVTAINSQTLEARAQTNIVQVSAQAPNVTLKPAGQGGGHAMIAYIRGIGQTDFDYAVEPGVGIYVDDVYYPTLTGSMINLLDVDRVEILRGPQGTLAGRNSEGGAIKIFSKAPDHNGGGNVSVTYGSYNRVDLRGNVSLNLIDNKLYARVSGASRQEQGYVKRIDYRCSHPNSLLPTYLVGGDRSGCVVGHEGGQSYTGGRVYLQWLPSNKLTLNIIADSIQDNSEPAANTLLRVNEGVNNPNIQGYDLNGNPIPTNGADYGNGPAGTFYDLDGNYATTNDRIYYGNQFVTTGPYAADPVIHNPYVSYDTFLDPRQPLPNRPGTPNALPPVNTLHQDGVSVSADWNITDKLDFRSITAYREYSSVWAGDGDASPIGSQQLLQRLRHRDSTQEFRLNGQAFGNKLDYTVGSFYLSQQGTLDANVDLYYAQLDFLHGPDQTPSTSKALFGDATWHLTNAIDLSLGLRRTEDRKTYSYHRHNLDGTIPLPCNGPPSAVTTNPNCVLRTLNDVNGYFSGARTDWRAVLAYHLTNNIMWYAQSATGYKGGGINPRPFFLVQIQPFNPEQLTAYETGLKTVIAGGHLRLNTALFYNDYTDIQINQTLCAVPTYVNPTGFGGPCLEPSNAGDAHVKGAEVEAEADVGKWLMDFSTSTLNFQYTKLSPYVAVTKDMITPYTPKLKWSLGVQYTAHLPSGGSLTPRLDVSYQGAVYTNATNNEANRIPSYRLANVRLTWRSPQDQWEASLEGTNVSDKLYYETLFEQYTSSGTVAGQPGPPRMWALSLKRNF